MKSAALILLTLSAVVSARLIQVSTNVYEVSPAARYVVQQAMTWGEAYKSCKKNDGHLIVINSQREADDLVAMVGTETVFVGVHDKYMPGKYVTVTGEALGSTGYDRWFSGAPEGGSYKCVAYANDNQNQGFLDLPCVVSLRSVCEQRLWSDYELIEPYGYYKMSRSKVRWPLAWQSCRQDGAHLIIVNSQAELDAVYDHFPPYSYAFLGIHQSFFLEEFVTVFNDKLNGTGYATWSYREISAEREFVSVLRNKSLYTELNGYDILYFCEHEKVQN